MDKKIRVSTINIAIPYPRNISRIGNLENIKTQTTVIILIPE